MSNKLMLYIKYFQRTSKRTKSSSSTDITPEEISAILLDSWPRIFLAKQTFIDISCLSSSLDSNHPYPMLLISLDSDTSFTVDQLNDSIVALAESLNVGDMDVRDSSLFYS